MAKLALEDDEDSEKIKAHTMHRLVTDIYDGYGDVVGSVPSTRTSRTPIPTCSQVEESTPLRPGPSQPRLQEVLMQALPKKCA